jgi:hypothetical protein
MAELQPATNHETSPLDDVARLGVAISNYTYLSTGIFTYTQLHLQAMGCDTEQNGIQDRLNAVHRNSPADPKDAYNYIFDNLAGICTSALVWRNNTDFGLPANLPTDKPDAVNTQIILNSFMAGLNTSGISHRYAKSLVVKEVISQRQNIGLGVTDGDFENIKYLDQLLIELGVNKARVAALRASRFILSGLDLTKKTLGI